MHQLYQWLSSLLPSLSTASKLTNLPQPSTAILEEEQELSQSRDYLNSFEERAGKLFINGEELVEPLRGLYRDQARQFQTSQLYELIQGTAQKEANDMALLKSQNWEHVLSAKMLHHYAHVMKNTIYLLAK